LLPRDTAYLRERYGTTLVEHGYRDRELRMARPDPAEGSEYILRITAEAFESARQK